LYLSEDVRRRMAFDDSPTGVQRLCKINGWTAYWLKQRSFSASCILSWAVRENTLVIFQFLPSSAIKLLDYSAEGTTKSLIFLPSLVTSRTDAIKANSTMFPNSVILWIKSLLSLVVLDLVLMKAASLELSTSKTGLS